VELATATKKRVRALEDANNIALFATALDTLDADAQDFFRLRRAAVLQRMRAKDKPHQSHASKDNRTIVEIHDDDKSVESREPDVVVEIEDNRSMDLNNASCSEDGE
jgi:hypothetical protein